MKNSLSIEYALHSATILAMVPENESITIKQLAHIMGITPTYLAKVFTQLSKAGFIRTSVGSKGGISLEKDPKEISAYDVFVAINGREHMFQCSHIRTKQFGFQPTPGLCEVHATMWEAEDKMYQHLKEVRISDFAEQAMKKFGLENEEKRIEFLRLALANSM